MSEIRLFPAVDANASLVWSFSALALDGVYSDNAEYEHNQFI